MILMIIVAVIFGYFLLLFLVKELRTKEKENDLANTFEKFVLKERILIDHHEILGKTIVALNSKNKKLVVVDETMGSQVIDLKNVASTRVVDEKNEMGFTIRIALQLDMHHNGLYHINFFDSDRNAVKDIRILLRKAGWWKKRIDRLRATEEIFNRLEYVV